MSKTQHTPTPWHNVNGIAYGSDLYSGDTWLGYTIITSVSREQCNANADFIVRACNSYESDQKKIAALVEALEAAQKHLHEIGQKALHWEKTFAGSEAGEARWREIRKWAIHQANQAALALAKGES